MHALISPHMLYDTNVYCILQLKRCDIQHRSLKDAFVTQFQPKALIDQFDRYLADQTIQFEAVVIGGAALALLGVSSRTTRDVDLLTTPIPPIILRHAREFARIHGLAETWLNDGPCSLKNELPPGWESQLQKIYEGSSLTLWTLDRLNLIISKLYAACDRNADDVNDLIALQPSIAEIEKAMTWVVRLDGNPDWPAHVVNVVARIKDIAT